MGREQLVNREIHTKTREVKRKLEHTANETVKETTQYLNYFQSG